MEDAVGVVQLKAAAAVRVEIRQRVRSTRVSLEKPISGILGLRIGFGVNGGWV